MNYKKIFTSQKLRVKLLGLLDFVPDKIMIRLQYKLSTGKKLNLNKPLRYTEKLQWYKLYYRDPLMTECADKYKVRSYVERKGLEDILVPLYGVYDDANEIDFSIFPNEFVLKTTNGSHTNVLVKDKQNLNITETIKKLNDWLKQKRAKLGREWSYYNIEPKIISEQYLNKDEDGDLVDYKFFCFNGKPEFLYVISDRFSEEKLSILDMNFEMLPVKRDDVKMHDKKPKLPTNFNRMVEIVKILSEDFPHVRVDLYNIDGVIYFGELTFYSGSGYKGYTPDEFDFIIGEKFHLKKCKLES